MNMESHGRGQPRVAKCTQNALLQIRRWEKWLGMAGVRVWVVQAVTFPNPSLPLLGLRDRQADGTLLPWGPAQAGTSWEREAGLHWGQCQEASECMLTEEAVPLLFLGGGRPDIEIRDTLPLSHNPSTVFFCI